MKDKNGKEIKEGQTIYRIIENGAAPLGTEYLVVLRKWEQEDENESLVALRPGVGELITQARAKEYEII